jgi:hypothetical protein
MVTFNHNEVPHLSLGFNSYGIITSDPGLTEALNSFEDGVPTDVLVELVTSICLRDGLEYICDEYLAEDGVVEPNKDYTIPAVSLKDWLAYKAGN